MISAAQEKYEESTVENFVFTEQIVHVAFDVFSIFAVEFLNLIRNLYADTRKLVFQSVRQPLEIFESSRNFPSMGVSGQHKN